MAPKQVVPLTAEQQQLAARWLPLARKLAARHGVDLGVTLEAVCKAARGYDPSRGWTFQAWATRPNEPALHPATGPRKSASQGQIAGVGSIRDMKTADAPAEPATEAVPTLP